MDDLDKDIEKLRGYSSPLGKIYQPPKPKPAKIFGNMYEVGSCSRKLGYRYLNYAALPHSFPTWKSFIVSRAGESFVKERLTQKGYKIIGKNKDVELMGFTGRIDGIIVKDNELFLLECKTILDPEKLEFLIRHGVKEGNRAYYSQIQAYLSSIRNVKKCLLIVLGSDDESWDDTHWHEEIVLADTNFQDYVRNKISQLKSTVEKGELPLPEENLEEKECEYCNYRHHCKEHGRTVRQHSSVNSDSTILSCKGCKQLLRVPANRGLIRIRCPKCGHQEEWEP